MSSFLNKIKDKVKSSSSGGGGAAGGSGGGGGIGGAGEKYVNDATHKFTDQATDRVGLGDKYDDKINKFTDSQTNKQIPGGNP